jgi:hypothetical protein
MSINYSNICINYFPKNNHFVVDYTNSFSNSYACCTLSHIKKQKESALSQKFWKIYVSNYYNEQNIFELEKELNELNESHKITSSNILYAVCIENKQSEIIWSSDEVKIIYEPSVMYMLNILNF